MTLKTLIYITKVHDDICFALVHAYSSLLILTKILSIFTFAFNKPFIYFGIQNTLEMKLIKQNKHNFLILYNKGCVILLSSKIIC